jgi:hypothetical protein
MRVMSKFLNQWRKPTGKLGGVLAWVLNISHSKGTRWGLQHITIGKIFPFSMLVAGEVNSHFYWPDLVNEMEVRCKPG